MEIVVAVCGVGVVMSNLTILKIAFGPSFSKMHEECFSK